MPLYVTYRPLLLNFLALSSPPSYFLFSSSLYNHPPLLPTYPFFAAFPPPSSPQLFLFARRPGRLQRSHAATRAAPSTAAPSATATTTTTSCAFPATRATLWRARRPPSARPAASGASSRRRAEVRSSDRAPAERRDDWQLDADGG